jgi:endonuclease-3 related protein
MTAAKLYKKLFSLYGAQGWWPVRSECKGRGYHPNEFGLPKTRKGKFEVCMGAILTQNTAWTQVEKALTNLFAAKINTPEKILKTDSQTIATLIAPAGYRNQKTTYLKNIAEWFKNNSPFPILNSQFSILNSQFSILNYQPPAVHQRKRSAWVSQLEPTRNNLLQVKGVGRETADSILLYAFHLPTFVIDTYTKRTLAALKIFDEKTPYETLRLWFMDSLEPSVELFQEYHALFVEHGKRRE